MSESSFTYSAASAASQLPPPDAFALAHSKRLLKLIHDEIERSGGALPFDRFMDLALYAPGLGYYAAGSLKFGQQGDFITAPELSPLFARCLAQQTAQVLGELQAGDILEFGAGSGVLAADLLLELDRLDRLPGRYFILEVSPDLRQRQVRTVQARVPALLSRVAWLDDLPEESFSGVVLANELFDAFPVMRFRVDSGGVLEQFITTDCNGLNAVWKRATSQDIETALSRLMARYGPLSNGYESEISPRIRPWLLSLEERFRAGLLLLIDYGYPQAEYYHPLRSSGTLMCHYRHRAHDNPLILTGLQDITAHVDFTHVAESAHEAGFAVLGYTSQALFLLGCGLERLVADSDPDRQREHLALMQGVKRLTLPSEMGERFKVIGLGKGITGSLIGFSAGNQLERL